MVVRVDCEPHRQELRDRVTVAKRLMEATKPNLPSLDDDQGVSFAFPDDVSREARGLAVVLLFAAYEHLLTSLCRSLLEAAARSRARARRLKPGIQLFLVHGELAGLADGGRRKLWKLSGPRLITALGERPAKELDPELFPDDGSFMKASQVKVFCDIFDLGDPAPVLREVWDRINAIVDQRNAVAHGRLRPEEVGRDYSHDEMLQLTASWEARWTDFLTWVESNCHGRAFYLAQR